MLMADDSGAHIPGPAVASAFLSLLLKVSPAQILSVARARAVAAQAAMSGLGEGGLDELSGAYRLGDEGGV